MIIIIIIIIIKFIQHKKLLKEEECNQNAIRSPSFSLYKNVQCLRDK